MTEAGMPAVHAVNLVANSGITTYRVESIAGFQIRIFSVAVPQIPMASHVGSASEILGIIQQCFITPFSWGDMVLGENSCSKITPDDAIWCHGTWSTLHDSANVLLHLACLAPSH